MPLNHWTLSLLVVLCLCSCCSYMHAYGGCVLSIPVHCMNSQSKHNRMRSIRPLHLWTMPLVTLSAVLRWQQTCPWVGMSLLCPEDTNSMDCQFQYFRFQSFSVGFNTKMVLPATSDVGNHADFKRFGLTSHDIRTI